jgi:pimeloyl-ACP methyl ester carboxylesterase
VFINVLRSSGCGHADKPGYKTRTNEDQVRPQRFTLPLTVDGTRVEVAGLRRDGTGTPLVFLHGFGSSKEDYAEGYLGRGNSRMSSLMRS